MSDRRPDVEAMLIGESGAGKSKILNSIFNNDANNIESLTSPANTSVAVDGVTKGCQLYVINAKNPKKTFIDCQGFSDRNQEGPEVFISIIQKLFSYSNQSLTHILFVIPLGRISEATALSLKFLKSMFEDFERIVIIVITKADSSTDDLNTFLKNNQNNNDNPVVNLVRRVNNIDPGRIVIGSMQHDGNQENDVRFGHQARRKDFFDRLNIAIDGVSKRNHGKIKVKYSTWGEFITHFLQFIPAKIIKWIGGKSQLAIFIEYAKSFTGQGNPPIDMICYTKCRLCNSNNYTSENPPVHSTCGHIFCKNDLENWCNESSRSCPRCQEVIKKIKKLPLLISNNQIGNPLIGAEDDYDDETITI